jgi:hypothetical protein
MLLWHALLVAQQPAMAAAAAAAVLHMCMQGQDVPAEQPARRPAISRGQTNSRVFSACIGIFISWAAQQTQSVLSQVLSTKRTSSRHVCCIWACAFGCKFDSGTAERQAPNNPPSGNSSELTTCASPPATSQKATAAAMCWFSRHCNSMLC